MKKLTKSSNRMICGVCAGIGEYLGIDATVVRLLWVIFSMLGGSGILAYIIAAIIIFFFLLGIRSDQHQIKHAEQSRIYEYHYPAVLH